MEEQTGWPAYCAFEKQGKAKNGDVQLDTQEAVYLVLAVMAELVVLLQLADRSVISEDNHLRRAGSKKTSSVAQAREKRNTDLGRA